MRNDLFINLFKVTKLQRIDISVSQPDLVINSRLYPHDLWDSMRSQVDQLYADVSRGQPTQMISPHSMIDSLTNSGGPRFTRSGIFNEWTTDIIDQAIYYTNPSKNILTLFNHNPFAINRIYG